MPNELNSITEAHVRVSVPCAHGLHLRPATRVVQTAQAFQADVWFEHEGAKIDAKSIMDILIHLAPAQAKTLVIKARGVDAHAALQTLNDLFLSDEWTCDEVDEQRAVAKESPHESTR